MKKGFTLIELLAVVMIMGILTSVALPQYTRSVERARVAEAQPMMKALSDARDRFETEYEANNGGTFSGTFPLSSFDLEFKGTVSGNQLTTSNYQYTVFPSHITAKTLAGKYANEGGFAYYQGEFICCYEEEETCDRLGVPIASVAQANRFCRF